MNQPAYLGVLILELKKILIYKLLYYVKAKLKKGKLCYVDTDIHYIHKNR